ncbi:serine/threonine-protein kinase [Nannocystis bainbridge]|uniref:Protein kinase n=1 Tax=Nannocystis bainbridge TaxID=2995303 RepID=A0ABT5E9E6_9BACT|nr:serine/threonine-protein kinase [Nannocystis bainbridge]MDC0722481.1 protein kinase [Nannocystis bainbridge]
MKLEAHRDPLPGSILEGRYRLVRLLGRGGMGSVYVAEETRLGRSYALKLLKPELTEDRAQIERFLREAQTIARLEHPNIVDIHSFGEDPSGFVFFTMELLTGEDLESRIAARSGRPYSVREACAWAIQIARAVGYVHQNGLIHRDLKTQNVFLARTRDGGEIIKLLDFGIARPESGSELTRTGNILGTPSYMSPEQIRDERLDRRSDIYSFGVLLFKLLIGRAPFVGEAIQVAMHHLTSQVPPPSSLAPGAGIPPALDELVLKALSKQPGDRYASMEEVERALVAVYATPLLAPPVKLAPPAASSRPPSLQPEVDHADEGALSLATTASLLRPPRCSESPAATVPASSAALSVDEAALDEVTARSLVERVATDPALIPVAAPPAPASPSPARTSQLWRLLALGASLACLLALATWLVARLGLNMPAVVSPATAPPAPSIVASPSPPMPDTAKSAPIILPDPAPPAAEPPAPSAPEPDDAPSSNDPEDPRPTKVDRPKSEPVKPKVSPPDPIARIKERARACRRKHNAVDQPALTVEFAVGSDGAVLRATPASDTPLAICLADAVKQARFEPKIRLRQEISL